MTPAQELDYLRRQRFIPDALLQQAWELLAQLPSDLKASAKMIPRGQPISTIHFIWQQGGSRLTLAIQPDYHEATIKNLATDQDDYKSARTFSELLNWITDRWQLRKL